MSASASEGIDTSSPRFKLALRQELLRLNAPRMLAFCITFAVLQALTLLASSGFSMTPVIEIAQLAQSLGGIWLSFKIVAIILGVVYALLFGLMTSQVIHSFRLRNSLFQTCLVALTLLQFVVLALELSNPVFMSVELSSFPLSLINCLVYVLMLGILPLVPRLQSILYLGVFTLLYAFCLSLSLQAFLSHMAPVAPDLQLHSFAASLYVLIVVAVLAASLCASWLSFGLVEKNVIAKAELEQQRVELETLIEARTIEYKEKARTAEVSNLAKTRFLTRVSHEMRTSMNTISGMVFLAKETEDPASRRESLEAIDQASQKLKSIVDNIIDTTKIELDFAGDDFNQDFALLSSDTAAPLLKNEPVQAPDLTGFNILIVEDLETNRLVLREFLKDTNATVEEAVNGKEAVEMFAVSAEGHYCFIFMDLLMPEMNGHDATRAIRKMERADAAIVPIVAVSANAFKEDIEASLAAGMDAHIAKPIEQSTIFRTLNERLT